ncbi:DUF58 domain-containing protein [Nocardioides acrostichi]|uniref:DUF58 domain-containing protein n=1 Tax=Nocardioides acrostichi TaxID=2784339 RepID=A0A930YBM1_9ACTN|nr:DUF58 domain-containing protein [Nocardioides acrostichi]MBF4160614.1 DUF58 domain-containing protein [Nocardioides acrostichi]
MREALRGLTLRGRAFCAGGVAAIVCAVLLGQPALSRVGVLAIALPLVTALVLSRTRYRLGLVRSVGPALVAAGQPARVTLSLSNDGRAPSGVLLLEDKVPYVLGTRPRFVLEGVRAGWQRRVTYQVRSDVRGRFEIGPMTVRITDPFGLIELGRTFTSKASLVVTPAITVLPVVPLGAGAGGSGEVRPRSFATGSAEDVTVREYRRGDDLRRVHWRSSARTGDLMVRREEQPWQARATVLLDHRAAAHRGQGVASSLETAVSAAASVVAHLTQRGFWVRLATADGELVRTSGGQGYGPASPEAGVQAVLESLAVLEPSRSRALDSRWLGDGEHHGLVVAVLGDLGDADTATLRRIRSQSSSALALALDVDAWVGAGGAARSPALRHQGWRSIDLGPRDRLDSAWRSLARAGVVHAAAVAGSASDPPGGTGSETASEAVVS